VVGHFPVHTFSHILEMRSSSKATCKMSPLLVQQQCNFYLIIKLHAIFSMVLNVHLILLELSHPLPKLLFSLCVPQAAQCIPAEQEHLLRVLHIISGL
jgi:hypothetical protein